MNKFSGYAPSGFENASVGKAGFLNTQNPTPILPNGPLGSDPRETAETYRGELFRGDRCLEIGRAHV